MALNYSNSNKGGMGLLALFPTRSYAQESAIEDRKLQFLAMQANQERQNQQQNAQAIADYDSKISQIQEQPFIGQDKKNIRTWLDDYQKKIKEKVKSDYSGNHVDFIQAEGAFLASKIQKDFLSSDVYRQGNERRVYAGLAMEAIKKGEKLIGEFDKDGKYKTGDQRLNDYFTGASPEFTYRGSYKFEPNKVTEYFAKQPKPFGVEDLKKNQDGTYARDEKGNYIVDYEKNNPYSGYKVPENQAEQYILSEIGSSEAFVDFKARNPRFLSSLTYSNDPDKALKYNQSIRDQKIQEENANIAKSREYRSAEMFKLDKENKQLSIEQKRKDLAEDSKNDISSQDGIFAPGYDVILPTAGIDTNIKLNARGNKIGSYLKDLTAKDGKSIRFVSLNKINPNLLANQVLSPRKDRSGSLSGYHFLDSKVNIIVPGVGQIPVSSKRDYTITSLDSDGILKDEQNQFWLKGVVRISQEAYNSLPSDKRKSMKEVMVPTASPKNERETIQVPWYVGNFYSPLPMQDATVTEIVNKSLPAKSKMGYNETPLPAGNADDVLSEYYN